MHNIFWNNTREAIYRPEVKSSKEPADRRMSVSHGLFCLLKAVSLWQTEVALQLIGAHGEAGAQEELPLAKEDSAR